MISRTRRTVGSLTVAGITLVSAASLHWTARAQDGGRRGGPLAPHFSITFSQPMVAVTSHEATVASVPVKISPEVAGAWRWVGTKTLLFEPKPRFPMATVFAVEVPAGTLSAVGGKLEKA